MGSMEVIRDNGPNFSYSQQEVLKAKKIPCNLTKDSRKNEFSEVYRDLQ